MARPRKQGLDYFPLDVDIDQDDKIQLVEAVHGPVGFAIVIKLLMRIYKDGYFSKWTETEQLLFSKRVNVDINLINECIKDCVKWDLFDKSIFETHGVLTSNGIQTRFLEAVGRRQKVEMIQEYLLLELEDIKVYKNLSVKSINVDINLIDVNINPQSKVKESKVNESKVNQTTTDGKDVVDDVPKNVEMNDKKLAEVTQFYSSNIGNLVPHIGDELGYMIDEHPSELIIEALKRALEANATNKIRYANSILTNWKNQLLKTLDEVKAADQRRTNSYATHKGAKVEVVPDWFGKHPVATSQTAEVVDIAAERERLQRELAGG
ncbi:Lin1244/Lin1753 domain-containing protein [Psychrobacillus sp.]|uniref:Lin1244/Lin1753 domain-containing protein n=1 Tax=Psychrobacillus sp. TaxID=1871623 RepID=UPI0028BDD4D1|nr:Lin1244/Lin1753 domain-containing protein [Psychrobacillus sp.]